MLVEGGATEDLDPSSSSSAAAAAAAALQVNKAPTDSQFVHIFWSLFQASEPEVVYPERNNIEINEGKTLIVKCRAKGKPNPKIVWIKNQRNLVLGNNVNVQKEEVSSGGNQQLVSTLQISRISLKDAGNYTCKAENNHGSIQKWVYVAVQSILSTSPASILAANGIDSCPQQYCLNNGTCSSFSGGIKVCNCSHPYQGDRCERSVVPYKNYTESCKGKVLDCFHRTDRILTVTGIGLVMTMFFLILLISWYLSRQRRRDFDFWRQAKRENERYKCVQVGRPLWQTQMQQQQQQQHYASCGVGPGVGFGGPGVGMRSVGTDVEYDLCQPEWPEFVALPSPPPLPPPTMLDRTGAAMMAASSTLSLPPSTTSLSATGAAASAAGLGTRSSPPEPPPNALFYRPMRYMPSDQVHGAGLQTLPHPAARQRPRSRQHQRDNFCPNDMVESEIWIRRCGGGAAIDLDDDLNEGPMNTHEPPQHQQRLCLCSPSLSDNQHRPQQHQRVVSNDLPPPDTSAAATGVLTSFCNYRLSAQRPKLVQQVQLVPANAAPATSPQQQQQQQQRQHRVQYFCHCPDQGATGTNDSSMF